MGNFIGLVYSKLKEAGVDTSKMSTQEAIDEYNKRFGDEKRFGDNEPTDAEKERLKEIGVGKLQYAPFEQTGIEYKEDGSYAKIDYAKYDKIVEKRNKFFEESFRKFKEEYDEDSPKYDRFATRLSKYTGNGYQDINTYLRTGKLVGETIPQALIPDYVDTIDQAIKTFELPDNILVYRGIPKDAAELIGLKNIDESIIGQTINSRAFASTTLDKSIAKQYRRIGAANDGYILELGIPKGNNKGIPTWNHSEFPEEQEFLLKRDSNFRITGIYEEDGIKIIKGEWVDE